ncbi:hypothetical protein ABZZ79_07255 [Streptomyces sp. NPDC006458]|uniref:hypothetical protein n=1 Tax=Streptomyces sp. NPDC006458 TaxID=3154302 RepID=UPI00339F5B02
MPDAVIALIPLEFLAVLKISQWLFLRLREPHPDAGADSPIGSVACSAVVT